MKIALIHNAYGKVSGEEVVIDELIRLLIERGHEIVRFSRSSEEILESRIGQLKALFTGIYNPSERRRFRAFLQEELPDVVHVHNVFPLISPAVLPECTKLGVPLVMTIHNFRLVCPNGLLMCRKEVCHRCLGGKEWQCLFRNCEANLVKSFGYMLRTLVARKKRFFLDHVDRFIALTSFHKELLSKEGLPAERTDVIPNPVSIDAFSGTKPDGDYVLFLGRLAPEKGIDTLLEAAQKLSDVSFKLVGNYNRLPGVEDRCPPNVELVGAVGRDQLETLYLNARMFVLPSVCYEGFPTVLLEAMSYRLPVLCSRIGGLPDIIEDGKNGLLFEPGNSSDLTEKIDRVWNNPEDSAGMGLSGKEKLLSEYGANALLDRVLDSYAKAIEQKRA